MLEGLLYQWNYEDKMLEAFGVEKVNGGRQLSGRGGNGLDGFPEGGKRKRLREGKKWIDEKREEFHTPARE